MTDHEQLDDFVTPDEFLSRHPNLFERRELGWLIKNRQHNNFSSVVKKITARKFLIHVPSALTWINNR